MIFLLTEMPLKLYSYWPGVVTVMQHYKVISEMNHLLNIGFGVITQLAQHTTPRIITAYAGVL